MRLQDTKRHKVKPKDHQRPMGNTKGRPRTKERMFAREGAYAIKARVLNVQGSTHGPWRWYGPNGFKDHWFERCLMPLSRARSIKKDLTYLGGQQARIVTVWRSVK